MEGLRGGTSFVHSFSRSALLHAARRVCDARGAVLIFDEVQCGVARCGAFSAAEAFGVVPDVLTFAKGLGAGIPIAAVVATEEITSSLSLGDLGSTFGGGPVPCAAALANIAVIKHEQLIDNAVEVGSYLTKAALALGVARVSGRGLLRLLPPLSFSHREADILMIGLEDVLQ